MCVVCKASCVVRPFHVSLLFTKLKAKRETSNTQKLTPLLMCLSPSTDPESEERPITGQPWGRGDLLGCAPHFGVSPGPGWKKRGSAHHRYPESHGALHRSLSQGPFFEFFRQLLYWFIHILFLQTVREIVLLFYQKKKNRLGRRMCSKTLLR